LNKWLAVLAAGGYLSTNAVTAHSNLKRVYSYEEPVQPPYIVSIIAPGWHEPDEFLESALSSLKQQNIVQRYPEQFEFIFVGCEGVSLQIPARLGYKILCAPQGKLTARHLGITSAVGGIIVAVDCDSIYPPNWLNLMLKPYVEEKGVVATTSTKWNGALEPLIALPKKLYYATRMTGRGSTFLKSAYFAVGGFNLNVDQRDIATLMSEEEIGFKKKLEKLGKVVLVDAPVIHLGEGIVSRGLHTYLRGKRSYCYAAVSRRLI